MFKKKSLFIKLILIINRAVGNTNLSIISLTGVAEALNKQANEGTESKGIKAHFAMDDSGVLNMVNVELVFEKTVIAVEEEEGTFSKLGSTISKLFAGLCYLPCGKWS